MTSKEYLEYLIFTQTQYEAGEIAGQSPLGVQTAELKMLQAFLKGEQK